MKEEIPVTADDYGGIDNWPVRIGLQAYEEEASALICDGWTKGYGGHLSPCGDESTGSTIAEIRADLLRHVTRVQHYRSPYETMHASK